MDIRSLFNWGKVGILAVDVQNDFCHRDGAFAHADLNIQPAQAVAVRIRVFIEKVRQYEVPIIYTQMIESETMTPANLRQLITRGKLIKSEPVCAPDTWGSELCGLTPVAGEYVLQKSTYDAFSNPILRQVLDANGVKTLIIIGVHTDVCIDSTLRRAFTEGYQIVIPKDLVATMNQEGEEHYLKVFDRFFGDVVDSGVVLSYLNG